MEPLGDLFVSRQGLLVLFHRLGAEDAAVALNLFPAAEAEVVDLFLAGEEWAARDLKMPRRGVGEADAIGGMLLETADGKPRRTFDFHRAIEGHFVSASSGFLALPLEDGCYSSIDQDFDPAEGGGAGDSAVLLFVLFLVSFHCQLKI